MARVAEVHVTASMRRVARFRRCGEFVGHVLQVFPDRSKDIGTDVAAQDHLAGELAFAIYNRRLAARSSIRSRLWGSTPFGSGGRCFFFDMVGP